MRRSGSADGGLLAAPAKKAPTLYEVFMALKEREMSTDTLTEQDIENKFTSLSLAFKTDKLTLNNRLELQQRQRDTAERNIDQEILQLKEAIKGLNRLSLDSEAREVLRRLGRQVDVLKQSAERVSSSAEVYGAVQQEARIARAIEIMLLHVDNLKRTYEREHAELEEAKKVLADNHLTVHDGLNLHSFTLAATPDSPGGGSGGGLAAPAAGGANSSNASRPRSSSVMNPAGSGVKLPPDLNSNGSTDKFRRASLASPPSSSSAASSPSASERFPTEFGRKTSFPEKPRSRWLGPLGSPKKTSFTKSAKEAAVVAANAAAAAASNVSVFSPIDWNVESRLVSSPNASEDNNNKKNSFEGRKLEDYSYPAPSAPYNNRVRSKSMIEPVKEEDEEPHFDEMANLERKRDSSPATPQIAKRHLRDFSKRSVLRRLTEWYQDLAWPFDWDETILGVRYCLTGALLLAAFISVVATFIGGGNKQEEETKL